jgi:SAM-dependent methyltransferase
MTIPVLFDRPLARLRQARACVKGGDRLVLPRLAEDMADRLAVVMRDFATAVDLGTPGTAIETVLHDNPRIGHVIHAGAPRPVIQGTHAVVIDEELLPFRPQSLDLVVSALALHKVNDLPGVLAQVKQALKPDGLFLGVWPGGDSLAELREAFALAETELTGGITPRVFPRMDIRDAGALMQRAGFALPVVDRDVVTVRYSSLFNLFEDLRLIGGTNILASRSRRPMTRVLLARVAEIYAERFSDPDGKLRVTVEMLWASGWSPHASQQKPLAPGSAAVRLADALSGKA